jgi:hypothetical protein
MCRFKYIFALTVIAGIASTAARTHCPPTHEEMAQGRDLKLYDDGGDYYEPDDAAKLPTLRAFIWDHWTLRKRGYVRFTPFGVDASLEYHIFIEPKKHSIRHAILRRVNMVIHHGCNISEFPEVFALERTKSTKDGDRGQYVLVFRDHEGKEVMRL